MVGKPLLSMDSMSFRRDRRTHHTLGKADFTDYDAL